MPYPIVPGHEIAGVIDAVGDAVIGWAAGTCVGVGWFGGHCGRCEPCRRGYLVDCRNLRIPGINYDGGYAEAMVAPADALVLIPDDLSAAEAAPLLCAGVSTYNALRESGARPGDLVAILGIGGLGHLGVQFAKMGFRTVAIARGREKEKLARQLGAHVSLDSQSQDVPAELMRLGGAKTILGDRDQRQGDECGDPGPGGPRPACRGRRRDGPDRGLRTRSDRRQPHGYRPCFGRFYRLTGYIVLQRAYWRAADHRDDAVGTCSRGLRQDDAQRGPLPHGADDWPVSWSALADYGNPPITAAGMTTWPSSYGQKENDGSARRSSEVRSPPARYPPV